jgi:hypothetical protein
MIRKSGNGYCENITQLGTAGGVSRAIEGCDCGEIRPAATDAASRFLFDITY